MSELRAHSGKRKRPIGRGEVESFAKRRRGSQRERQALMQLYSPLPCSRRLKPSEICPDCAGIGAHRSDA